MTFRDFITPNNRNGLRNTFPDFFKNFQTILTPNSLTVSEENGEVNFKLYNNNNLIEQFPLTFYLDSILGGNMMSINNRIISHYTEYNHFNDNLPLYLIRRHGSYSGFNGGLRRRRGWLIQFKNAWIVYADNFFSRHVFDATYFVDGGPDKEFSNLNNELIMPYSSGGGQFERIHRIFPSLTHLSSRSKFYLSHLYELNQGNYFLENNHVSARSILGNSNDGIFGTGVPQNWADGPIFQNTGKRYRIINHEFTPLQNEFLVAYNVRMLSPFNYFPFPKEKYLREGSMNGENHNLRNSVVTYLRNRFNESFNNFETIARI
jgi:hypothetical protein